LSRSNHLNRRQACLARVAAISVLTCELSPYQPQFTDS
jgi:hypothetical protein